MARINPYLTFNGNCEEAFKFYRNVFGGEFQQISRYGEMPQTEDFLVSEAYKVGEAYKDKIMHMSLPLSNETFLMGSDNNPSMGEVKTGDNISLSIDTDSKQEADRIFQKLAEGGNIFMPIDNTFWNAYFGMLTDKFKINWMISYNYPTQEKETSEKEHAAAHK